MINDEEQHLFVVTSLSIDQPVCYPGFITSIASGAVKGALLAKYS